MSAQVIQFPHAAAKRRAACAAPAPYDACTRVDKAESLSPLPSAIGLVVQTVIPCRDDPARVHRVTSEEAAPRLPFFSTQYRPQFVETAALVFGYLGILIVGIARWAAS